MTDNKEITIAIWGMLLLTLLVLGMVTVLFLKFDEPLSVALNGYSMTKSDILEGDVKDFVLLAQRFNIRHPYSQYDLDSYNCVNYTNDLYYIARELGFNVEKVVGCREANYSQCHAWLRLMVDFEPQHGVFADYSKEYPLDQQGNPRKKEDG